MCYRGGRGVVPPAGIRSGQMTVKFRGWSRNIATQMYLGNVNAIQAWPTTEIHDMSGKHLPVMISFVVRQFVQHEHTPIKTLLQTAAIFTHANSS